MNDDVKVPAKKKKARRRGRSRNGTGTVEKRGENRWRLRFTSDGQRCDEKFTGTSAEAQTELNRLLRAVAEGTHVAPTKVTVGQWIEDWLDAGAPGRRQKKVSQRTLERYGQLLRTHVKPVLGDTVLQQLRAPAIDKLYNGLYEAKEIAPRTQHHVHVVLGALLATAHRKGMIAANPMLRVEQIPNAEPQVLDDEASDDIGEGLEPEELKKLVEGFSQSSLYPVVALAATTGARRGELLALRWSDLDIEKKTLRIERALEQTKKFGIRCKPPKTKRGLRTIDLDDAALKVLLTEREKHQRLEVGIPDGAAAVDLGLLRLPAEALMFPAVPETGEEFDLTKWRNPRNFSKEFARRAEVIGFGKIRFHDLRGIHATALVDALIPIERVAQRIGDDPAVLQRNYMKRKRSKQADQSLSDALATLSAGFLGK